MPIEQWPVKRQWGPNLTDFAYKPDVWNRALAGEAGRLYVSCEAAQARALEQMFKAFPGRAQIVITRALNRAGETMRTEVVRRVADRLGIGTRRVGKRVFIARANYSHQEVRVRAGRKGFPYSWFKARQEAAGVEVQNALLPRAFIVHFLTGHVGVVRRKAAGGAMFTGPSSRGVAGGVRSGGERWEGQGPRAGERKRGHISIGKTKMAGPRPFQRLTELTAQGPAETIRELGAAPEILQLGHDTFRRRIDVELELILSGKRAAA